MKPGEKEKERIAELEKELAKVTEQRDGLLRDGELEAVKPASKSRPAGGSWSGIAEAGGQ